MGWLRARVGIPSFVITLATFLAFQGVTLILIGGQGSVILPSNSPLIKLENSFVPLWLGWTLLALLVIGYAAIKLNDALGRRRAGLSARAVHGDRGEGRRAGGRSVRRSRTRWASTAT